MSHRKMLAFWHYGIQPAFMIPVEAYGMSLMHIVKTNQLQANGVQKQGL